MAVYVEPCKRGFVVYRKSDNGMLTDAKIFGRLSTALREGGKIVGDNETLNLSHDIVEQYKLQEYCGQTFTEE